MNSISLSRLVPAAVIRSGLQRVFYYRVKRAAKHARCLVVASPWLSCLDGTPYSVAHLCRLLDRYHVKMYVFTRAPSNPEHQRAVEQLKRCEMVELVYNENLHAKIYVCVAEPAHGFAILGSANLTARSQRMYEVGLLVLAKGGGDRVVNDLASFGLDYLRTRPESVLVQRISYRSKKR